MSTVCAFESNTVTYFLTKDQTDASRSTTWHHTCLQVTGFPLLQSLSQRLVNLHMGCALSRLRNSKRAKCYQVDDRQHNDDRVAEQQVGNMLLLLVSRCCMLLPHRALSQPLAQATGGFNPYRTHSTISLRLQLTQGPLATHTNTAQQQSAHTMNQPQLTNLQCHKQSNRRLNWTQKTTCSLGCDQKQESSCQGELSTPVRMSLCGCCSGLHLEEPWCSSKHGLFSSVLRSRVTHLLLLPESTHKHSADCLCVLLQVCQGSAIHHRQLQGTE